MICIGSHISIFVIGSNQYRFELNAKIMAFSINTPYKSRGLTQCLYKVVFLTQPKSTLLAIAGNNSTS